jgi:hypothetical protein
LRSAQLAKARLLTRRAIESAEKAEEAEAAAVYQVGPAVREALAGDSAHAARLADDLGKRFPKNTIVQFNYLPTIHAAGLLRGNDAGKATEVLAAAAPYELGGIVETFHFVLYTVYLEARRI